MLKKKMFLCIFQSLILSISFASASASDSADMSKPNNKIVKVDHCSVHDNLTSSIVKFIQEKDIFIDEEGNNVKPCLLNDNNVYFKIISPFEDGKKIFKESIGEILNKNIFDNKINNEIKKDYIITYGSDKIQIEDMDAFMKAANAEDMKKITKEASNNNNAILMENKTLEEIKQYLNIPKELVLPEQYNNYIDEEKIELIKKNYKNVIDNINLAKKNNENEQNIMFVKNAVDNNRILINNNNIINQYPIESDNINYKVFYLYETTLSKIKFDDGVKKIILDYISDNKNSLNDKIAFLEYCNSEKDFSKKSNKYLNDKYNEWQLKITKIEEMNNIGEELYKKDLNNKESFFNELKNVNQKIIENEFSSLPEKLTKKQYHSLSDIDKYKYTPEIKGKRINREYYHKNTIDYVLNKQMKNK